MTLVFSNGGFETGDFTDWATTYDGSGTCVATVNTSAKYFNSYGCELQSIADTPGYADVVISQNIDLTGISSISFRYKVVESTVSDSEWESRYTRLYISIMQEFTEHEILSTTSPSTGDWIEVSYDTSSLSGIWEFRVEVDAHDHGAA